MDLHDMVSRQQHELLQLQRHASASSHAGSVIGMMSVEESQNLLPAGEQVAFGCVIGMMSVEESQNLLHAGERIALS